jgi:predicted lipoprotein with Yx(FWY)xxD motif
MNLTGDRLVMMGMRRTALFLAAAPALFAVACGGGGNKPATVNAGAGTPPTLTAHNVAGLGDIVVDNSGHPLYSPAEESSGTIMCTASCAAIWPPVVVDAGTTPTAATAVNGRVGTVMRPDGKTQVTLDGHPLYRFSRDGSGDKATGNGLSDAFGGHQFSWHAVDADGSPLPTSSPTSGNSGGYGGYGGYGGG